MGQLARISLSNPVHKSLRYRELSSLFKQIDIHASISCALDHAIFKILEAVTHRQAILWPAPCPVGRSQLWKNSMTVDTLHQRDWSGKTLQSLASPLKVC